MAIELAAAWARLMTPPELVRRLGDGFSILATAARDVPARQTSLQKALDWTLGLLEGEHRKVFARWGVFAGRPTLQQAEAICGLGLDALPAIEALLDLSLLRRDPDGHLRMPQSVHVYTRQLLEASGELDEVCARHASVMADLAESQHVLFWMDTEAALTEAEIARGDLYAALHWARSRRPDLHARLAGSMALPLLLVGTLIGLEPEVEAALAIETEPTRSRVRLLIARGVIAYARGDRGRELESFEQAARESPGLGDDREEVLTLAAFAKAVVTSDQPSVNADELLDAARASAIRAREPDLEKLVDGLRAEAYLAAGRVEEAERLYAAMVSDPEARHFAAHGAPVLRADFALARGDYRDALHASVNDLRLSQTRGLEVDTQWHMQAIGCCLIALGHAVDGLTVIAAGEERSRQMGTGGRPRPLAELITEQSSLARTALGDREAERALERGRRMPWDAAKGLGLRAETIAGITPVGAGAQPA